MASHLLCPPPNLQPQHSCLSYMQLCSRFLHQTTPQNLCIHTSNTLVLPSSSKCREHNLPVRIATYDHKCFCVWHIRLLLGLQGMAMFSLICYSVKLCHGTLWLVFLCFFGVTSFFWFVVAHQVHVLCFTLVVELHKMVTILLYGKYGVRKLTLLWRSWPINSVQRGLPLTYMDLIDYNYKA